MIRIGLSRWQIIFENTPANNGMQNMCIKLIPQASKYKVYYKKWLGLHSSMEVKSVGTKKFEAPFYFERFQKISHTVDQLKKAAGVLASDAVTFCLNNDIVDSQCCERGALIYLVNYAIMRVIESGVSDNDEPLLQEIDLIENMMELRRAREREIEAQRQIAQAAYERHVHDTGLAAAERKKIADVATQKSFEFLNKFLTVSEKEMLEKYQCIKISNLSGDFFIRPYNHSMVDQFVDGKFVQSHCVVFQDYTLPIGDEAAMKIALLKGDIQRFMKISNKFNHQKPRMPF